MSNSTSDNEFFNALPEQQTAMEGEVPANSHSEEAPAGLQDVAVNSPDQKVFDSAVHEYNDDEEAVLHDIYIPVHSIDAGLSLPTAEEIRNTVNPVSKKSSTTPFWVKLSITVVVVFSILLGVTIGVSRSSSSNGGHYSSVVNYLVQQGVANETAVKTKGTPQNQAAAWLAEQDALNLVVPNTDVSETSAYRFMARYVLAVTFFSLTGPSWPFPLGFLEGTDICKWNGFILDSKTTTPGGVTCDPATDLPIYLTLSTCYRSLR
jgi:hypothetical protein